MGKDSTYLKEIVEPGVFKEWQEVDAVVYAFTDLGMKVAINDEYTGLVYKNEVYENLQLGQGLKAFIKCVREDGRIDVSLQPRQENHVVSTTDNILEVLKAAGGELGFNDSSSPEEIKNKFQISKRVFKQAIGVLYKQRKIKITDKGIEIVK
ncbi:MAG: type I-B CRISPR-associated protein Cas8b1/Cst1 [Candidatus Omnitrophica bacterium]|nr:type I-B CRISPR-associated protein Cas8b1/Cst1 [Candidatus Omnitrophota bacterium]